jgi:hypothetical protein
MPVMFNLPMLGQVSVTARADAGKVTVAADLKAPVMTSTRRAYLSPEEAEGFAQELLGAARAARLLDAGQNG